MPRGGRGRIGGKGPSLRECGNGKGGIVRRDRGKAGGRFAFRSTSDSAGPASFRLPVSRGPIRKNVCPPNGTRPPGDGPGDLVGRWRRDVRRNVAVDETERESPVAGHSFRGLGVGTGRRASLRRTASSSRSRKVRTMGRYDRRERLSDFSSAATARSRRSTIRPSATARGQVRRSSCCHMNSA